MRQILATGKKSNHGAPELGNVVAYCSAQHRVFCLYRIEHCTLTHWSLDSQFQFAINPCERAQVRRENDANHFRVCTSTDSTAGRSRTMGFQLSPASAYAYTCPPVVPN